MTTYITEKLTSTKNVAVMCNSWSNVRNNFIVSFIVTTPTLVFFKIPSTGTGLYIASEISPVIDDFGTDKVLGVLSNR